jgi:tetraacyldisaccharide 4'-kinase
MFRQWLHHALLHAWTGHGLLAYLLWPTSLLYRVLTTLRRQFYALGILKTEHAPALVIVVGNVITGGAGKTPTVIALVRHLRERGLQVGVISRGYGRTTAGSIEVLADSLPQVVGDEPLLIHRATHAPVWVGDSRHAAAMALLARHPQTQILVCDDGLQHYGLYRDLEICVFDDRGIGNGWLLPAGPLREPWPRRALSQAGQRDDRLLVLHTGSDRAFAGFAAQRSLAPYAVGRDGTRVLLETLRAPGPKPLLALAGIARPQVFFGMLHALQLPLAQTLALPDHYDFDSSFLSIHGGYTLICTEKDAAKLWQVAPEVLAIPLVFEPEPAFFAALDGALAQAQAARLSSGHGHQTS